MGKKERGIFWVSLSSLLSTCARMIHTRETRNLHAHTLSFLSLFSLFLLLSFHHLRASHSPLFLHVPLSFLGCFPIIYLLRRGDLLLFSLSRTATENRDTGRRRNSLSSCAGCKLECRKILLRAQGWHCLEPRPLLESSDPGDILKKCSSCLLEASGLLSLPPSLPLSLFSLSLSL